ncbi:MAG: transposase [Saprospiraceae bacterium]|jgi:transposase
MKEQKQRKARRTYDAAFKANILKMNADGRTVSSLSDSFGVNENLIYRWKKLAQSKDADTVTKDLQETIELREQVKSLKEERDILKKALAIFSRHP